MRLSATDASFLYTESVSGPMHISSIYVLEGVLSFEQVFDHIAGRIHLVPSFMRKIAYVPFSLGHPKWVDDPQFDLANHIHEHRLPTGASLEDGIDFAIELNEPMLDRSRPLWNTHVIGGVEGKTLLLHVTHHAMIDGASGIELAQVIYDLAPDPEPVSPPDNPWHPQPTPSGPELFQEAMSENLQALQNENPGSWLPSTSQQRAQLAQTVGLLSSFFTRPVITAPFNASIVGPKRRLRYIKRPFSEIREIRRALGGTINDVVLAVVTEAVARYLSAHDEPAKNQHLRVMCPVNVRTEDLKGALGNQVSGIFPVIPAWPMSPRSRLAVVCAETERIKQNEDAQAMTLATESSSGLWPLAMAPTQLIGTALDPTRLAAHIPWPVIPNIGWRPPNPGINFVCTNVPGVQVPMYLAGHRVTDTIGVLILSGNIGFSTTVLSYNKELFINYICEPRLLPDLELMISATTDAFDELLSEARTHTAQLNAE